MRRLLAGLVTAAALVAATAAQAQQTLILGGSDAVGSVIDRANAMFTKLVNERAGGKLKINFIQGEQLGSDMQVIEQMMRGSVHVYGDVLDWYANWVKDLSVLAWGFTFRDMDHMAKFLESDTYKAYEEELRAEAGRARPRQGAGAAARAVHQEAGRERRRPRRREDAGAGDPHLSAALADARHEARPRRLGRGVPRPEDRRHRRGRRAGSLGIRGEIPSGRAGGRAAPTTSSRPTRSR